MYLDASDEIKLPGGVQINACPAELVRVTKDGKAFSLRTGEVVDIEEKITGPFRGVQRSASEEAAEEDQISRPMMRRRRYASPEELALKNCRQPGCNREFTRSCDLAKHEKTHSRPWKCPVPTCRFNDYGWPTEKELHRHHNDKHSSEPPMFKCRNPTCTYKSKRESNCKQHMEKAHGWPYIRTKTNRGKRGIRKSGIMAQSTPQITPQTPCLLPISNPSIGLATPPEEGLKYQPQNIYFPACVPDGETMDYNSLPQEIHLDPWGHSDYSPMDDAIPMTDPDLESCPVPVTSQDTAVPDYQWDDSYSASYAQVPTSTLDRKLLQRIAVLSGAELVDTEAIPQISPAGKGNTMLFTPESIANVGGVFGDMSADIGSGPDFTLFPPAATIKNMTYDQQSLFSGETPSVTAGFSQLDSPALGDPTVQDMRA